MTIYDLNNDDDFTTLIKNSDNLYAIVDFYAPWCGPCKKLSPELEKLSEKYTDLSFIKVNVDEHDEIADKYEITSLPTILVFATKNCEIEECVQGIDEKDLEKLCQKYE
jgi:thioredoxin 1